MNLQTRGEGVKNPKFLRDVQNGTPLPLEMLLDEWRKIRMGFFGNLGEIIMKIPVAFRA